MNIEVHLLGPMEVVVDGRALSVGAPRTRRMLAALLLNANCVVAVDRLLDLLWDFPPSTARQQVHNTAGSLRSVLQGVGKLSIEQVLSGYRLTVDPDAIDLTAFRCLVRSADEEIAADRPHAAIKLLGAARALWRGAALYGVEGGHVAKVAARLEEERLSALELLLDLQVQAGQGGMVLGELMELVAAHPLREALRASLMAALYGAGRQADALAVYDEGRRRLVEEFGLDPGPRITELRDDILHGRNAVAQTASRRLTQTAPSSAPVGITASGSATTPGMFLPYDFQEFAGREEQIAALLAESRRHTRPSLVIASINGMGGVGKTALAVRCAHLAAADYPDGQFFVDLRGFSIGAEPLTTYEALGQLLRQSGVPEELIPAGAEARIAAWRANMAGKRAFVVLDNAVGAEQVKPLLPGASGPMVIITSRRRLDDLDGARPLSLDVPPLDEATEIFHRVVGSARCERRQPVVAAIAEQCGRLPLALRIAAARFRERTSWTPEYLLEILRDRDRRAGFLNHGERGVSAVLALSCRDLAGPHRSLLSLLGLHPGPVFTAPLAAALAEIPMCRAREALDSLFDENLAVEVEPGHYRLHDLVRDAARRMHEQADGCTELHTEADHAFGAHLHAELASPLAGV